jgi:hypothetical protein
MATMGRREMNRKPAPEAPQQGIAIPAVNLGVIPTVICPVTTAGAQPQPVGGPIMREGFITTTGVMTPGLIQAALRSNTTYIFD